MKNPFWPLAGKLYRKLKPILGIRPNRRVEMQLALLYPAGNKNSLYDNYQSKKLAAVFALLAIGVVSAVCILFCSQQESRLAEGARLERNEWGAGDYQVKLQAMTQEWTREIPFVIGERELTEQEIHVMADRLQRELPELIKKDNQDLLHVEGDLTLPASVPGYPFRIIWNSGEGGRINGRGEVDFEGISTEGERATLTASLTYGEKEISYVYEVALLSRAWSEEENFFRALEEEILKEEQNSRYDKTIALPESVAGRRIEWKEVGTDAGIILPVLMIPGCVAVCREMDRNLKRDCDKRRKKLLMEYSGFVNRLRLYLSAGLTVKSAFFKITSDYEGDKGNCKRNFLYEEIMAVCHKLENGMAEEQVYQEFGTRCGEMCYRRLASLLSVHLRQGNSRLLSLLEEEADAALENRRNMAKKAGEEAGTRLLIPMMLMLLVVMFLILLPAWINFSAI